MKKILLIATMIMTSLLINAQSVDEQTDVVVDIESALAGIADNYGDDWYDLSMKGKLRAEGLAASPTVKIYMKRSESVIMSFRVPIVGEVARIEMCPDSLTFINKMSKKYWSQPLGQTSSGRTGIISDIQDLLLGKVAYPGYGRLTEELSAKSLWSYEDDDLYLMPMAENQYADAEYFFMIDDYDFKLTDFILHLKKNDIWLNTHYNYGDAGWSLGLAVENGDNIFEAIFELSYPDFAPIPLEMTDAGTRYSRTDLNGILKF